MHHEITGVEPRSVAEKHGLKPGDLLVSLNGEPVIDEIDYQALIASANVKAKLLRGGKELTIDIRKKEEDLFFVFSVDC